MRQSHAWTAGLVLSIVLGAMFVLASKASATDNGQFAQVPQSIRDWYASAELTPEAQKRFHFKSCCAKADVVRTQFRVGANGDDTWEYLDANVWKIVPPDIIQWGKHAPDGQPTLFVVASAGPVCFFPPEGGI